jgi:2,5-diamino-6-(ribosylamino)-4(3H)-pyrimidinone 5'-phosphate reductase
VDRLYPPGEVGSIENGSLYKDLYLSEGTGSRPYVVVNMVSTVDGKAAIGGKAGVIGSDADRIAMRNLRSRVDAVMVGAGTLRTERISLNVPRNLEREGQPLAVVITGSGDIPLESNLAGADPERTVLLVPEDLSGREESRLRGHGRLVRAGSGRGIDLSLSLELLRREHGVERLLVEGGPSLNGGLIERGLVDELFLTVAPGISGRQAGGAPTIVEGPELPVGTQTHLELISVHSAGSELFLRYGIR